MTGRHQAVGRTDREPIAIVGIGCRFPGASTPARFWQQLVDGVDAIREIPRDRFDVETLYDERPATPGKIATRWGGFVDGLDRLDAEFFGVSPREAERLDPQQRMLLETAWEAIEDAGIVPESLIGSTTGVFVGIWNNEYESRLFRDYDAIDFYMTTGTGRYAASGRLSYFLGLQGPSLTLDTGCSSSLVAVHLACQSLWTGESELVLSGAANAILEPFVTIAYSQSGMMAPDGRCKFGDAAANGYVRSDGAAVIVLKPLAKAIADGNPIYATILGSAVTNDGRSSGFMTTPAREGQEAMLRLAYRDAGISPGRVHYVEAHGTGTRAGDPVELTALGRVLSMDRASSAPCRIGSVKTNIGHTEGAAGMAGLIKTALSLKNRTIPKSLHCQTPNPEIPWGALPLVLQQRTEAWPAAEVGIAGVSSFGISGTNAHVVLAEAPGETSTAPAARPAVLVMSGHSSTALRAMAAAWREFIAAGPSASFVDTCHTAGARRAHHTHRAAFAATSFEHVTEQLDAYLAGESRDGASSGQTLADPKVAFVFPGQGSQWVGMGRSLYATEPAFRIAMDRCDEAIAVEAGWSVVDVLMDVDGAPQPDRIDVVQPALFAVQVSLAALWSAWGIRADAVVGHSMGEVAAAYIAGALSMADAVRVICLRSRLLSRTSGNGAMAVVELTGAEAAFELRGREHLLSIAVCNSSRSTVISGNPAALDDVLGQLELRGVFCRRVNVDVASHSPQMDPLCAELAEGLVSIRPAPGSIRLYSTAVSGCVDGSDVDSAYWVKNLRNPVMFGDAVQQLLRDGHTVFIEMSPHPILTGPIREGLADAGITGVAIGSTRREEDERLSMLGALGAVYTAGVSIDWQSVYPGCTRTAATPTYAFQRERFWYDAKPLTRGVLSTGSGMDEACTLDGALFTPDWEPAPANMDARPVRAGARTVLLGSSPVAQHLRAELERRGVDCLAVETADLRTALERAAAGPIDRVVHLSALDEADVAGTAEGHVWDLVQCAAHLASGQVKPTPSLTVVTRGAHRVVAQDRVDGYLQGTLWGVHRAAADEHPDLDGGLIDLDEAGDDRSIAAALATELASDARDQVALRGDARYVLRLRPHPLSGATPIVATADASYFIAGGLGDLGLEVANWLVDRGARRIVLAGRTPLPPRTEWLSMPEGAPAGRRVAAVRALERKGASIHLATLDVADKTALLRWVRNFRKEAWPSVRGVVHCAGVLEPHLLSDISFSSIQSVLTPKVAGVLALQAAFDAEPLEFFLLFSSIASILPAPGQVSYAAANAFLDSFSQRRRAVGQPACAINWAAWKDLGMAAALGSAEQTSSRGVARIGPGQARAALDASVGLGRAQLAVTPFIAAEWRQNVFPPSTAAFQSRVLDGDDQRRFVPAEDETLRNTLTQLASSDARRDYLENWVRVRVASVLGRAASRIDVDRPLRAMGLDSLMGLQLRSEFEKALALKLPATIVWNYPTVSALAGHLGTRLNIPLETVAAPPTAPASEVDLDALLEEIAALPQAEARRLLAEQM